MKNSKISWCDHTWNPWRSPKGTPQITSAGYWRQPVLWNAHFQRQLNAWEGFKECNHPITDGLLTATGFTKPTRPRVFCGSLCDWLDDRVPIEWLADLLALIHNTPNLNWLMLTKRPQNWKRRMLEVFEWKMDEETRAEPWEQMIAAWIADLANMPATPPPNVWMGTTVEDQTRADERIPELLTIPAKVRFLSCEPLLGPVDLGNIKLGQGRFDVLSGIRTDCACDGSVEHFDGDGNHMGTENVDNSPLAACVNWLICGGESGPKARPMRPEWARSLRDQCASAGVPYFFKQWGNNNYKPGAIQHGYDNTQHNGGNLLDGRTHEEFPV